MKTKLLLPIFILFSYFTLSSQNLIAFYPFNGNANDESGNTNNGTIIGATLTTDRFGNANSAYYFDGVSNYISITDSPNINIQTGESFSISFWVKHDAQNNAKYMISKYKGSSGEPSYAIGTGSIGDSYSWYEFSPGGIESRGTIDLNDNNWHNITSVFKSGESVSIYVDGVLDISHPITYAGSIINTRNLTIGCGSNLAQFYKGSIDDVKIYNKALSLEEIKNEVNGLVAYYPFNGNANDESGNNHHGTLYGPTLTTDRNGNAGSAYYFDGVNDYIDIGDWENGGPMSFTFWARWDAFNSYSRIIDISNGTRNNDVNIFNWSTSNEICFYVHNTDIGNYVYIKGSAITLNQWDFYVATVNISGHMKIYKNGILVVENVNGNPIKFLTRIYQFIGKSIYSSDGYFKGAIDELRIYQSVLTESEILNLYTYNTLKVEKIEDVATSNFYVHNNILYFKDIQNLTEIIKVEVYNLFGQKIFKTVEITKQIQLNILPKGIYILKVKNKNGTYYAYKFLIN